MTAITIAGITPTGVDKFTWEGPVEISQSALIGGGADVPGGSTTVDVMEWEGSISQSEWVGLNNVRLSGMLVVLAGDFIAKQYPTSGQVYVKIVDLAGVEQAGLTDRFFYRFRVWKIKDCDNYWRCTEADCVYEPHGFTATAKPVMHLAIGASGTRQAVTYNRPSEDGPIPCIVNYEGHTVWYSGVSEGSILYASGTVKTCYETVNGFKELTMDNARVKLRARENPANSRRGNFDLLCYSGAAWVQVGEINLTVSSDGTTNESLSGQVPTIDPVIGFDDVTDPELGVWAVSWGSFDDGITLQGTISMRRGHPFVTFEYFTNISNTPIKTWGGKIAQTGFACYARSSGVFYATGNAYSGWDEAAGANDYNTVYMSTSGTVTTGALIAGVACRTRGNGRSYVAYNSGTVWSEVGIFFSGASFTNVEGGSDVEKLWFFAYEHAGNPNEAPSEIGKECLATVNSRQWITRVT